MRYSISADALCAAVLIGGTLLLVLLSGCTAIDGEVCRANGRQFTAPEGCARAADFGATRMPAQVSRQ
jgi:hypothetical protein